MLFKILTLLLSVAQLFGQLGFSYGTAINITEAPWQASILVNDKHRCGGVIYSKDIVLTTAMCVKDIRKDNIAVRVGSDEKDLGGLVVPVSRVTLQLMGLRQSDVAILALEKPIEFSDKVKAIELATWTPRLDTKASLTGWAEVVGEKGPQDILMRTDLRLVSRLQCRGDGYFIKRILAPDELCASKSNSTNVVCQGFSGGPLVADGKLIGIGSWHTKCDFLQSPSIYADIALIRLWIRSIAGLGI